MHRNTLAFSTAVLLFSSLATAAPAFAKATKLLVVPLHGKAGAAFDASVVKLLETPLKRHADVIAAAAAKQAARRANIAPAGMKRPKNLRKLGKAVGANYVLAVEATGRLPNLAASTTLIDVASGRTVLADRYTLVGAKITADVASEMLSPLVEKLGGESSGMDPGGRAADEDATSAEAPAKISKSKGKFAWPQRSEGDAKTQSDDSADPTERDVAVAQEGDDAAADSAAKTDGEGDSESDEAQAKSKDDHEDGWRPALRLSLGASFLQRDAHVKAANPPPGVTAPCYCGTARDSNPFFPGGRFSLELFPLAFNGHGKAIEGLGVSVDLFATQVRSYVATPNERTRTGPAKVIASNLFGFRGGATYRLVLWDSRTAPDIYFNAGYALFTFPLSAGGFPGVSYTSPYVGATGHIPLGMEELTLVLGASVLAKLSGGNAASAMLGTPSGGFGFNVDGGLRFAIDRYEITALARYQAYSLSYKGQTALPTLDNVTPVQLNNVSLNDRFIEMIITAGVVF